MPSPVVRQTRQVTQIPTIAVNVPNTGVRTLIASVRISGDLETFVSDFGNSIQFAANANFATFDCLLNGSPIVGLSGLTSQIAPSTQPRHYFPGQEIPLGRGQLFEVYGTLAAGAQNTPDAFSVQVTLVSVTPGTRP